MQKTYDFDTPRRPHSHGAEKWEGARAAGMPAGVVPLTAADMEFPAAPEIIEAVERTAHEGYWGYSHAYPAYREAVGSWMESRHGWRPQPEWMLNTAGVVQALYIAVRAFTKPGDGVIIQPPVYPPFASAALANGRKLVENPLKIENGRYVMDFEDLRQKAKGAAMLVLCSPHNPVGRVWQREELWQLAEICREHNLLVAADEIHGDLVMPGHKHITWGALAPNAMDNAVMMTAASKTFSLAGLGCSSVFIQNEELRGRFAAQQAADGAHFNSTFGTVAAQAGYTRGGAWLAQLVAYVQGNYDYLQQTLAEQLPGLVLYPMEGTYLAWVDFAVFGLDDEALQQFLQREARLYINPGHTFGTGGGGFGRINLACPRAVLAQALEGLVQAAQKRGFA